MCHWRVDLCYAWFCRIFIRFHYENDIGIFRFATNTCYMQTVNYICMQYCHASSAHYSTRTVSGLFMSNELKGILHTKTRHFNAQALMCKPLPAAVTRLNVWPCCDLDLEPSTLKIYQLSSFIPTTPITKVWRNSIHWFVRCHANGMHAWTDARTYALRRTTWKHTASTAPIGGEV